MSHNVAQAGLRLATIFLPQLPKCWLISSMNSALSKISEIMSPLNLQSVEM